MPIVLSESDVRTLLPMTDLIDEMERALTAYSEGRVQQPLRTIVELGAPQAFFGIMPAYVPDAPALGTKLVTVVAANTSAGLPSHLATIVLLDPETGQLLGILDGRYITEARTAAVSAVSVKLLAREDAATLAIVGTGVQARSHLDAIPCVRPLRSVRVWSPNASSRSAFLQEARRRADIEFAEARSAREAVDNADIVVLATSSRTPVVESEWIAAGTHICAVGACRPDQREMDGVIVGRGRVFVDSRGGALAEAGDIVLAIRDGHFAEARIAGELGDVAAGRVAGRQTRDQITIFKSLGMAVEDVAAAHLAYTRATERGLGRGIVL